MLSVEEGDVFVVDGEPHAHAWFIVTTPEGPGGVVVIVMLVTKRAHTDHTCVLRAGDHHFITHDSSVSYSTATFANVPQMVAAVAKGAAFKLAPLDRSTLQRVQQGLLDSPYTVGTVRAYCAERFSVGM